MVGTPSSAPARGAGAMKIVSLLPSATEIVYALDLGQDLLGVSFECDFPEAARSVPVISGTVLPTDGSLSAREIDAAVNAKVAAGESIYTLDDARIRAIDPDLILAQDLCQVCAVPSGAVERALDVIGCHALVVSLDPGRLDEVIDCVGLVGAATGTGERADVLMESLRGRVEAVRRRVHGRGPAPGTGVGVGGPSVQRRALGSRHGGGSGRRAGPRRAGARSRRLTWDEIGAEQVDITVFMPCGFDLEGAVAQAGPLLARPEAAGLGQIFAVDANAHFSCPGPRVVDGVELLEGLLHEGAAPPVRSGARLLRRG